jgi:hypothetical protein
MPLAYQSQLRDYLGRGVGLYEVRDWSSPFFPVKVSERMRRFSGDARPSSPAMARVVGPGPMYGAAPEFDATQTP